MEKSLLQSTTDQLVQKKNVIAIRSVSYQKTIEPEQLQDLFYKTQEFPIKTSVQLHLHKLGRSKYNSSNYSTTNTFRKTNENPENRTRQKTQFDFDSMNYNSLIKTKEKPLLFLNFMHGKMESGKLHPKCKFYEEEEIQKEYKFKLPVIVSNFENEKTYINILMGFQHSFIFLENLISDVKKQSEFYKSEKERLSTKLKQMQMNFEEELKKIFVFYKKEFEKFQLKNDFVSNQNENFRLQKEITLWEKEKMNLELEKEKAEKRIIEMELKIFKVEMFNLITEDPFLLTIENRNMSSHKKEKNDFAVI